MRTFLEQAINRLWYHSNRFGWWFSPFSALFAMVSWLRHAAYHKGVFSRYRSSSTVIVVGNISVGGTGKTPMVIALIDFLTAQGHAVVVISRGFGRTSRQLVVVDDACNAALCGDEPLLIFQNTRVPVIVAATRVAAVHYCEHYYPDAIIISDDGLQHYALARDIEIAVIDGQRGFGNGQLLPAGPLREPLTRLAQVDFTVINGGPLSYPNAYLMTLQPQQVRHLGSGALIAPNELAAMGSWLALTAIGNPRRFFTTLSTLKIHYEEKIFPDHYLFKPEDLRDFSERLIIVTAKDAVKLKPWGFNNIYVLDVSACLPEVFYQALLEKLS